MELSEEQIEFSLDNWLKLHDQGEIGYQEPKSLLEHLRSLGWRSGSEVNQLREKLNWDIVQEVARVRREERVKIGDWLGQALQDVRLGWDSTAQPLLIIAKGAEALKSGKEVGR